MVTEIILYTLVALAAPQIVPKVRVRGIATALAIAVVFALLNVLLGWLLNATIALISLPAIILTLGLFAFLIPTLVNGVLLKLTEALLDTFTIKGWLPAFGMGFLFALARFAAHRLGG